MKKYNYSKGKIGEEVALGYLVNKGYLLILKNFEINSGEIDLIMSDNDWLVFVEVKYKSNDLVGIPEEMIGRRKVNQIRFVAEYFLSTNPELRKAFVKYRIDAVCIMNQRISHYINIDG